MKKIFLCAFLLHLTLNLSSQNDPKLPEVVPPSPTVANLMKFEEVPIDYYSGQPNISIPLFSKQIGKGINFNLGLNYSTSGIQIDSRSGWTGTGWSMFSGGSISRTIRDIPDEFYGSGGKIGVLRNLSYWKYNTLSGVSKAEFNWKAVGSSVNKYDIKPDLYQFNFMGYSGRFIIIKSGPSIKVKFISKNQKFKIDITYDSTTYVISGFVMTDPNGFKYTFDIVEVTDTTNSTGTVPQQGGAADTFTSNSYSANSAWHLSKITTPKNLNLATFTYTSPISEVYYGAQSGIENRITTVASNINNIINNSYNNTILEPKSIISQNNNNIQTRKLSSVQFRDGTSISILTEAGHPEFTTGSTKLKDVILKDVNGSEYKRFSLTYETSASRLWLKRVSEIAGGNSLDTDLTYYDKASLPAFGQGTFDGDSWGYYSGIDDNHSVSGLNTFDENQIKTGLLTTIEYPTGGVKEFNFEHNTYSYYGNQNIPYDDYMENPNNIEYQTDFAYNYTYSNGNSLIPDKITNNGNAFSFTLGFTQDIYISSFIDYSNSNTQYLNYHEVQVKNTSGTYFGNAQIGDVGILIPNLPPGTYELFFAPTGTIISTPYDIKANYRVSYSKQSSILRSEMLGGGVRIKSVEFKEDPSLLESARKFIYEYNDKNSANKSSGVIDAKTDKLKRVYSVNIVKQLFTSYGNNSSAWNSSQSISYDVTHTGVNINTQMTKGNFVGYRHVKVKETSLSSDKGYIVYDYTSAFDYPSNSSVFILPNAVPAGNIDYKRGLLKKQSFYDDSNRILKRIENTIYNFDEEPIYTERSVYKSGCNWIQFYDTWSFYTSPTYNAEINIPLDQFGNHFINVYYDCGSGPVAMLSTSYNSGWTQLKEARTKDYFYYGNNSGDSTVVTSRKTYDYNLDNYQIATENRYDKEKGADVHHETKYYYPLGGHLSSNTNSVIDRLVTLNKVNEVLETVTKKDNIITGQTHTIYNTINNDIDLVYPTEIKVGKGNNLPDKRLEFFNYDEYGNPLEVSKPDGTHVVYIWGYNKTQPIAKIENVTYAQVQSQVANLQSKSNADNDRTVDLRNTSGVVTSYIGNEGLLRQALQALRNSLPNSMVTTFTYDSLVGVTSVTDPRGQSIYYYYDSFNRLQFVKDSNGKILSENQYNYKN